MKPAAVATIKSELENYSQEELKAICLKLAVFKKDNKEFLSYLLFDASDEAEYIKAVKEEIEESFAALNLDSVYFVKKGVRKTLRQLKKQIRYSKKKETEAELLIHFLRTFRTLNDNALESMAMMKIYHSQHKMAKNAISKLHEDLQFDLTTELEGLDS